MAELTSAASSVTRGLATYYSDSQTMAREFHDRCHPSIGGPIVIQRQREVLRPS
jgi:hypothetical protein